MRRRNNRSFGLGLCRKFLPEVHDLLAATEGTIRNLHCKLAGSRQKLSLSTHSRFLQVSVFKMAVAGNSAKSAMSRMGRNAQAQTYQVCMTDSEPALVRRD